MSNVAITYVLPQSKFEMSKFMVGHKDQLD